MLRFLIAFVGAVSFGFWASAELWASPPEGSWRQVENDDGVKVWRLEVPGRDLPGFRGEAVIAAPLEAIVSVLNQVEQHKQWMHRCSESGTLQRFDAEHLVIYNRTDSPWPAWDRDVLLETHLTRGPQSATIVFRQTDPTRIPVPDRVIRMPRLEGFYRLTEFGAGKSKVVYQVEADIGGSIPGWIAERLARDMPFETLRRLRARVLTPGEES